MNLYRLGLILTIVLVGLALPVEAEEKKMDKYLEAVKVFADNVLEHGRDVYGPKKTPLFVDGINVDTLKPPVWKHQGDCWILSNLASQQNLLRVLDGLTIATGDMKYREAATAAIKYSFEHVRDKEGMLYWGGHCCYDALSDGLASAIETQEFKHHYPYYELMWQVNPDAAKRNIEATWNAHVINWENLDFNRHGDYGKPLGKLWDNEYKGGAVPFVGKGLTFMMSGTDLIYAAAQLSTFINDEKPLVWAERLARRYVEARHPETGLGAENFSVLENHRMEKQFPQFEGRFSEATVTDLYGARYTYCALGQLRLGETLGKKGSKFLQWGLEDLTARAKHGYDEESNSFWATLIDGTKLTPADRKQNGYVETRWLEKRKADGRHFLVYALAYKLSGDDLMWQMTRKIGRGLGLGDLGARPGEYSFTGKSVKNGDSLAVFGLLEIWKATGKSAYLDLAKQVADNALETQFHKGFFLASKDHIHAKFDDPLPLALLHLRAAVLGLPEQPPVFWLSRGFFHAIYDGRGRTYDHFAIYDRLRGEADSAEPGISKLMTNATPEYPRHSEGDIIALSNGKLLMAYGRKTGADDTAAGSVVSITSADNGKTWDEKPHIITEPWGDVSDVMSVSLCRTSRGIHLFFIGRGKDRLADTSIYQMISGDEGATWSAPERITKRTGYHVLNNARVIETTKGRMLVPLAFVPGSIYQMYDKQRVYCLYSDDDGKTWNETGEIGLPDAALMEPGVAECADGSIYMTLRTKLGFLYESRSNDGGLTWKDPQKTTLVSPAAPSTVYRDPSSDDLWMFWCANPKGGAATWQERSPLALAISHDNGKTWGPQRLIENDIARGFGYLSVDVVDARVHLTYYDWSKENPNFHLTNIRHRIIPLKWFHHEDWIVL